MTTELKENFVQYLKTRGFIVTDINEDEPQSTAIFVKKVSEDIQLTIVSTDVSVGDIMFIAEDRILKRNNKLYEDDHKNLKCIKEYYMKDFDRVMKKYGL